MPKSGNYSGFIQVRREGLLRSIGYTCSDVMHVVMGMGLGESVAFVTDGRFSGGILPLPRLGPSEGNTRGQGQLPRP